jgi:hypothetical protein
MELDFEKVHADLTSGFVPKLLNVVGSAGCIVGGYGALLTMAGTFAALASVPALIPIAVGLLLTAVGGAIVYGSHVAYMRYLDLRSEEYLAEIEKGLKTQLDASQTQQRERIEQAPRNADEPIGSANQSAPGDDFGKSKVDLCGTLDTGHLPAGRPLGRSEPQAGSPPPTVH